MLPQDIYWNLSDVQFPNRVCVYLRSVCLVQIKNHLDGISAQLHQPIIEGGQKLNLSLDIYWFVKILIFQQGVCVVKQVCSSTTLIAMTCFYDSYFKIPQTPPPPSSTSVGPVVVIQLLHREAGPNQSLNSLWKRNDSIDLTLVCEDSWGRSQPEPSNTHKFIRHSFADALKQWRHHWYAPGLWS